MENIPEQSEEKEKQNILPYFQMRDPPTNNVPQPVSLQNSLFGTILERGHKNLSEQESGVSQIFSSPVGLITWFFGLKWYVILFIVVFGMFLFFQIEYAIESMKNRRDKKNDQNEMKEGMQPETVERMKGNIRKSDEEYKSDVQKKTVSFILPPRSDISLQNSNKEGYDANIKNPITKIYNLWVAPWMYVLFRLFKDFSKSKQ